MEVKMHEMDDKQREMVEKNIGLAHHTANKWFYRIGKRVMLEYGDLVSICYIGLIKAVKSFDPSRGATFATYSVKVMDNDILMELRHYKRRESNVSYLDDLGTYTNRDGERQNYENDQLAGCYVWVYEDNVGKWLDANCAKELILQSFNDMTEQQQKIVYLKSKGYLQREIGKKLGLSQSYISRLIKQAKGRYEKLRLS